MMKPLCQFRVKASLENVPHAIDCVNQSAKAVGFDDRTLNQIQVAVDEACANVIQHAYEGQELGDMEIRCFLEDDKFVVAVRDWGGSFDPNGVLDPDVDAPLEDRCLGGLGLFLIRQFMDEATFSFDPEHGNELVMVKGLHLEE
jgi:serine/threonine-protein kinase RsbW